VQRYLLRRILYGVLALFGVSVIIFVVMRILPGDPLVAMFGMEGFMKLSEGDRARIMEELGLSDPLLVQYGRWMKDIASGRLGKSFFRGESVAEIIMHRGPLSAQIGLMSVLVSWIVGLPVGIVSAFRPNSLTDNVARFLSILFLAIPGFWLGIQLQGPSAGGPFLARPLDKFAAGGRPRHCVRPGSRGLYRQDVTLVSARSDSRVL
jgi:peptide/nickel transport system permease protein